MSTVQITDNIYLSLDSTDDKDLHDMTAVVFFGQVGDETADSALHHRRFPAGLPVVAYANRYTAQEIGKFSYIVAKGIAAVELAVASGMKVLICGAPEYSHAAALLSKILPDSDIDLGAEFVSAGEPKKIEINETAKHIVAVWSSMQTALSRRNGIIASAPRDIVY